MRPTQRSLLLPAAVLVALGAAACTSAPRQPSGPASAAPSASAPQASAPPATASGPAAEPSSTGSAATATAAPTASTGATQAAGRPWHRVALAGVSFEIPPTWHLITYGTDQACAQPVNSAGLPSVFGCAGIAVKTGRIRGSEQRLYTADQNGGWYTATDVQPCPVDGAPPGGDFNGIRFGAGSRPVETGLRPVGNRKADYDRWQAGCDSGYRFSPQGWYLPLSHVLFLDYIGHPETARLLASVQFPG
ncbi:hypothetical protein [Peterkaempfera griseoplana]|uniref:hypothetical protein n=1 Tax=Peterkaempfera griseoplana TaxID=66896 RepID=UPI0006E1919F|nr:hypothetical protein [Peterkaempfera griseoplana]